MPKPYRLGLDIGTNSIGWCLYELDEGRIVRLIRMGVRIFSDGRDPKTRTSLAVERRLARQMRRQRERTVQRRHGFLTELIRANLLPDDGKERKQLVLFDPYELRDRALREALPLPQFARALYHLARKRGFKSSRKDRGDAEAKKTAGVIGKGTERLRELVQAAECETVGQFLHRRHAERKPVLARPSAGGDYDFYPDRALTLEEFDLLWNRQRRFHPEALTQDAYRRLRHFIEHQRPLKAVPAGRCQLEPEETRARRGHPLFARFRVLSDLANLRIEFPDGTANPLTPRERDVCLAYLEKNERLSWAKLRNLLGIEKKKDDQEPFNLARSKKNGIPGDPISLQLSQSQCFGAEWSTMPADRQAIVIEALALAHDDENLRHRLEEDGFTLTDEQLTAISKVDVPDGFADLSLKAMAKLVPVMEAQIVTYDQAVAKAYDGLSHSDFLPEESQLKRSLPYYGEILRGYTQSMPQSTVPEEAHFGRLPNPTVHVGLNQLRKLVNAIIQRYGRPQEIIIELAREFGLSGKKRGELISKQKENEKNNERRVMELRSRNVQVNRDNLLRLRLYEELPVMNRVCAYSGKPIGQETLFSPDIEIDHILPFSRSLDDGIGNLVLAYRAANRIKGNRDPHGAFGNNPQGYDWESIESRVAQFAKENPTAWRNKAKRFQPGALDRFVAERGFLDRHLTDTAYLSRLAKQYLSHICYKHRVWVATGKLTAMLRGKWDLSDALGGHGKNRNDHRHHAIDAAVIGACDRRIIQQLSHSAQAFEEGRSHRFFEELGQPFDGFSVAVREAARKIVTSHKPDRDPGGSLHNATVYGVLEPASGKTPALVAQRVALTTLTTAKKADAIMDPLLRERILDVIDGLTEKQAATALDRFARENNVQKIRIQQRLSIAEIKNPNREKGRAVKTDGNAYVEILRGPKGWIDRVVTRFQHGLGQLEASHSFVMRLFDGDLIMTEDSNDGPKILRLVQKTPGFLTLAGVNEAGNLRDRHAAPDDHFRYTFASASKLRTLKARRITIDLLGFVHDPGFTE